MWRVMPYRRWPVCAGDADLSVMQGESEGRHPGQVLPRILPRVPADALRDASTQMPKVQRWFRCQRLPQAFLNLNFWVVQAWFRFLRLGTWCIGFTVVDDLIRHLQDSRIGVWAWHNF